MRTRESQEMRDRVLAMLERAPMTVRQVAAALDADEERARGVVRSLREAGEVRQTNPEANGRTQRIYAAVVERAEVRHRTRVNPRRIAYAASVFAWCSRPR